MMVSKEADMGTKRQKVKSSEAPPRVSSGDRETCRDQVSDSRPAAAALEPSGIFRPHGRTGEVTESPGSGPMGAVLL